MSRADVYYSSEKDWRGETLSSRDAERLTLGFFMMSDQFEDEPFYESSRAQIHKFTRAVHWTDAWGRKWRKNGRRHFVLS